MLEPLFNKDAILLKKTLALKFSYEPSYKNEGSPPDGCFCKLKLFPL